MKTAKILVSPTARLELYKATQSVRFTTGAEIRANSRLYAALGLDEIEEAAEAATPASKPTTQQEAAAHADAVNAAFAARFDVAAQAKEFEVSEAVAGTFRSYLDRMGEFFPAGKTEDGVAIPAGMPQGMVRRLASLIDAIDEAFPVAGEASKAA